MKPFLELAKSRYSCRSYADRPVEQNDLELVLESGRVAPSAVNFQPWHYYVIRGETALGEFHAAYHREWFRTAPCVIVICVDHEQSWKRKADGVDHALQATELGLATCWICNFDPGITRELLELPERMEPVVILPLGYPLDEVDSGRHKEKRRPLSELTTFLGE